eukprot:m.8076 g.8076  ORF g.8076 m.8076 type:complete len:58 (-) comp2997_c1_seq1:57-230(-)
MDHLHQQQKKCCFKSINNKKNAFSDETNRMWLIMVSDSDEGRMMAKTTTVTTITKTK